MQVDRPIQSAADYEIVTGIVEGMVDRFKAPVGDNGLSCVCTNVNMLISQTNLSAVFSHLEISLHLRTTKTKNATERERIWETYYNRDS